MALGDYLVGVAYLAATLGGVAFAAAVLVRRRLAQVGGAARVIAYGVVGTLVLVGVHLLPLCLGVLNRPSVVVTAAAAAALSLLVRAGAPAPAAPEEPSAGDRPASWALAAVALAAVGVIELGAVLRHIADTPHGIDALTFHVPGVARWIQLGSMWQIDQFVPLLAHGDYPNNGDVVLLAVVLPFHDDFLLRLVFVPFLALTGVAVYALARELRAPAAAAAVFAAVAVALPNVSVDATVSTLPDTVFFFSFVGGVLFLLRHQRTGRTSELVLAGVSLGLGFGTKWFGVSSVVATLVVWAGATLLAGRRAAAVARQGAALVGLIAATGGVWLLRNLLESGNPVFPQKVAVLGWTIFDAPPDVLREAGGFTIAHYIGRPGVWRSYLIPAFEHSLGLPGAVLAIGFLLGAGLAVWGLRRRSAGAGRALAVAAGAAVLAGVYAVTPFSAFGPSGRPFLAFANVRYGVAALLLAAGMAAWSAARLGRARLALELAGVVAVFEGLDRGLGLAFGAVELVIVLVGAAGAAALLASRRSAAAGRLRLRRPATAIAAAALLAVVASACGYAVQRDYARARFRHDDPTFAWIAAHAPSGHRVGLANIWTTDGPPPVLAMFGPRLGNRVAYVGHFVRHLLRQYGGRRAFVAALQRGRYDLLVIGRGAPPAPVVREEGWARAAGFRQVAAGPRFTLYARVAAGRM